MHVIRVRNVCEALPVGLDYLLREGRREESRAGGVLVAPSPVSTVYEKPTERVLFNPIRDANPAFHLMEAVVWMLGGRNDAAFLDNYVSDFGERFSDRGIIHDAYGYRWRKALGYDQLDVIVDLLRVNNGDRQCVLQMWDGTPYETNHHDDLRRQWKTKPCNTHVYFRVRDSGLHHSLDNPDLVLDIMVSCRSNDIIWGAYGANAVQFSILQEYMAARIGVGIGTYTQVSWNFHAYESEILRLTRKVYPNIRDTDTIQLTDLQTDLTALPLALMRNPYQSASLKPSVLVGYATDFDRDLRGVTSYIESLHVRHLSQVLEISKLTPGFRDRNIFLAEVVWPIACAMRLHRLKQTDSAKQLLQPRLDNDWCWAMSEWLDRRIK